MKLGIFLSFTPLYPKDVTYSNCKLNINEYMKGWIIRVWSSSPGLHFPPIDPYSRTLALHAKNQCRRSRESANAMTVGQYVARVS